MYLDVVRDLRNLYVKEAPALDDEDKAPAIVNFSPNYLNVNKAPTLDDKDKAPAIVNFNPRTWT